MFIVYLLVAIICFVLGGLVGFGVGVLGTNHKVWAIKLEWGLK